MTTYGIFENRPMDITQLVLDKMEYIDLASLSKSSKTWKAIIHEYTHRMKFLSSWLEFSPKKENYSGMAHLLAEISKDEDHEKFKNFLNTAWEKFGDTDGIGSMLRAYCCHMDPSQLPHLFEHVWNLIPNIESDILHVIDNLEEDPKKALKLHNQLHSLFLDHQQHHGVSEQFLVLIYKKIHRKIDFSMDTANFLQIIFAWKRTESLDFSIFETTDGPSAEIENAVIPVARTFKSLATCLGTYDGNLEVVMAHVLQPWSTFTKSFLFAVEPSLMPIPFLHISDTLLPQLLFNAAMMLREHKDRITEFRSSLYAINRQVSELSEGKSKLKNLFQDVKKIIKEHQKRMLRSCAHFNSTDNQFIRSFNILLI